MYYKNAKTNVEKKISQKPQFGCAKNRKIYFSQKYFLIIFIIELSVLIEGLIS